jgi:MFS family permease
MMALRFFMGAAEAGFGPGIPYLLSFFYLRHELGLRCGIFLAAAPLANTFAGALAYGITSGKHLSIANWRLLFLVEGLPTICLAPVVWFTLPDSPNKARFLNEEQKRVAVARGVKQAGAADRVGMLDWKDIGPGLIDPVAWFTAVSIHCRFDLILSSLSTNLPYTAHVLLLQRILRLPPRLPPHHPQRKFVPPIYYPLSVTVLTQP